MKTYKDITEQIQKIQHLGELDKILDEDAFATKRARDERSLSLSMKRDGYDEKKLKKLSDDFVKKHIEYFKATKFGDKKVDVAKAYKPVAQALLRISKEFDQVIASMVSFRAHDAEREIIASMKNKK